MKAICTTLAAATSLISSTTQAMEEIRPGVYSMKIKKQYTGVRQPHLEHGSPRVGDWEEAEEWNFEVKEPIGQLDNYLYTTYCQIGDTANKPSYETYSNLKVCVFDTTSKYSSAFASSLS